MSVRAESLEQTLDSAQGAAREVLMKYKAIFQELKGNQVEGKKLTTVSKYILGPLEEIDTFEFDDAKKKIQDLRKELDSKDNFGEAVSRSKEAGRKARDQMQVLIDKVRGVMENMTKEIQLNKVVESLRKIEQDEEKQFQLIKQLHDDMERQLLEGGVEGAGYEAAEPSSRRPLRSVESATVRAVAVPTDGRTWLPYGRAS